MSNKFFYGQQDYIAQLNLMDDNYNLFKGVWYGPLASDPTLDPLGNAPTAGDAYFNTGSDVLKIFNGTTWQASDINTANLAASGGAALVGNNTSGGTTGGTVQAALDGLTSSVSANTTSIATKEPAIASGTTAQYWRGDKSWRTFLTDVLGSALTGLSTATNATITATDTVLSAFGKLQKQITDNLSTLTSHTGNVSNPHSTTATQVGLGSCNNTSDANKPVSIAQQALVDGRTGNSSSAGFRNRIINGSADIDMWNNAALVTPTASAFVIDRWHYETTVASKLRFQQVTDAPTGLKKSLKVTVATQYSPASTDKFTIQQPIEGINVVDFAFGTAGALSVTLSNWVKSSIAGTYAVSITNSATNRSIVGTMAVTSSWTQAVITVSGDQSGTWLTDEATIGLTLRIDLGSGSNFNTASTNTWLASDSRRTSGCVTFVNQIANSTFNITGVQLEAGTVATSYEYKSIEEKRRACARYLPGWRYGNAAGSGNCSLGIWVGTATTSVRLEFPYKTTPSSVPTGILFGAAGDFGGTGLTSATAVTLGSTTSIQSGVVVFTVTGASVQAAGEMVSATTTAYLLFTGCELL